MFSEIQWTKLLIAVFCGLLVLNAVDLPANAITWTNEAGGDFETAGNWSPNQVPGSTDTAVFNLVTSPYTVTWDSSSVTNWVFHFERGTAVFDFQGNTYTYSCTNRVSMIGTNSNLTLTNGVMEASGTWSQIGVQSLRVYGAEDERTTFKISDNTYFWSGYWNTYEYCTVLVDGPNASAMVRSGWYIYGGETTAMIITNGGTFQSNNTLNLFANLIVAGENSRFMTQGLRLIVDANVYVGNGAHLSTTTGTFNRTNSVFTLDNATMSFSPYFTNCVTAVFQGRGNVTGTFWNAEGTVRPGIEDDTGFLHFFGDFYNRDAADVTAGIIAVKLGGTETNNYDQLFCTGTLYSSGTLDISLVNEFEPYHNETFKILDFADVDGEFDAINLPGKPEEWDVSKLYTEGTIRFHRPPGVIFSVR